jgi:glycosyltransferase involved in cell wall biosynthesis
VIELSVVIPTYRGAHRLPETLAAVARAIGGEAAIEVVVADDGSPQPLDAAARQAGSTPVRWVANPTNRGPASTRNLGLHAARGQLVLFLDDDMSAGSELVQRHRAAHRNASGPLAVVGRIEPAASSFAGRFGEFLRAEEARRRERLIARAADVPFTEFLSGQFSAPRQLLIELGGFATAFTSYGFEDIELGWRLQRHGVACHYDDQAISLHRSDAATWRNHCLRHIAMGRMARVFSRLAQDPVVDRFLRVDGMRRSDQPSSFRRVMALIHQAARRTPRPLAPTALAAARAAVWMAERLASDRALFATYHLVRDMHYAVGLGADEAPD